MGIFSDNTIIRYMGTNSGQNEMEGQEEGHMFLYKNCRIATIVKCRREKKGGGRGERVKQVGLG